MAFGLLCLYATIWDKRRNASLDFVEMAPDAPEELTFDMSDDPTRMIR